MSKECDLKDFALQWMCLNQYTHYLEEVKHRSKNTLKAYHKDLLQFFEYLGLNKLGLDLSLEDAKQYEDTVFKDLKTSTLLRKHSCLSNFYCYAIAQGLVKTNPFSSIDISSLPQVDRLCLGKDKLDMLVGHISKLKETAALRDKCIILLAYTTGIKLAELCNLKIEDYDVVSRVIYIRKIGGRTLGINLSFGDELTFQTVKTLEKYIYQRVSIEHAKGSDFLFLNKFSKPISSRSIRRNIAGYGKKAGLSIEVGPEVLRRSYLLNTFNKYGNSKIIAKELGCLSCDALKNRINNLMYI